MKPRNENGVGLQNVPGNDKDGKCEEGDKLIFHRNPCGS